jgi:hypothetical protein
MSNFEAEFAVTRRYELHLIRCTLTPSPKTTEFNSELQTESSDGYIKELLASIECGNYAEGLTSHSCKLIFQLNHESPPPESAEHFYSELVNRAESFITDASVSAVEQSPAAPAITLAPKQTNFSSNAKAAYPHHQPILSSRRPKPLFEGISRTTGKPLTKR